MRGDRAPRPRGEAARPDRGPGRGSPGGARLVIDDITCDGLGLAHAGGRAVEVDGALPGELVEVELPPAARGGTRARLLRVVQPSPWRTAPRCRHAGECGGCSWQHVAYREQLALKGAILRNALVARLGRDAPAAAPVVGLSSGLDAQGRPWGFRHKVHFVVGAGEGGPEPALGHYRRGSRGVVPVSECPVHAEAGNRVAFAVGEALTSARVPPVRSGPSTGVARHVVVRVSRSRAETLATLVVTRDDHPGLRAVTRRLASTGAAPSGFHLNVHPGSGTLLFGARTRRLVGRERVREEAGGASFLLSPTAFFQTNLEAADILVELVRRALAPLGAARVLDLYAGAGLFALPLALSGCRVVAVEESAIAVADGEASLRLNPVAEGACRFVRADAARFVERLRRRGPAAGRAFDAVVLDPPREGAAPAVLRALVHDLRPRRVVCVSCSPRALATDLALLLGTGDRGARGTGYAVTELQPVDMFPHTAHVEAVAVLTRADAMLAPCPA